jgi:rubredoxin
MTSPTCPRCGGQEFHELEEHSYQDSEELNEENKYIYKKQLRCLKCDFEFEPATTE